MSDLVVVQQLQVMYFLLTEIPPNGRLYTPHIKLKKGAFLLDNPGIETMLLSQGVTGLAVEQQPWS